MRQLVLARLVVVGRSWLTGWTRGGPFLSRFYLPVFWTDCIFHVMKLIFNKAADSKGPIQRFTCNVLPKTVRHDQMEGRDFIVVPMVILTEGVHCGSDGPMFYPSDELSKTPVVWNHKPVVVYHPEMNGVGISACDPDVITSRKVGVMMNTRFEKGKLKSEAWIEADRANLVDPRIMEAINRNEMMELSTGVFVDHEDATGEWNGETYQAIARNYRPDHLALLPDKIGACSIADGAGFLRNESGRKREQVMSLFRKALQEAGISINEMSHSNIRDNLTTALRKKFKAEGDNGPFLWVADVYNDFVIYELDGKLFRIGYTDTDTAVTLSDEAPVSVVRVTEYRTVTGAFVGNRDQNQEPKNMKKTKKEMVDALISNSNGLLVEADRERLMAFNENQLERIALIKEATPPASPAAAPAPAANATPTPAPAATPAPAPATNATPAAAAAAPAAKAPATVQEYIAQAPREFQDVLNNAQSVYEQEKNRLVDTIMQNKNHGFTKEDLSNRPIGELRNLARLAGAVKTEEGTPPSDYTGQAPVAHASGATEEPLAVPAMNFSTEKK